MADRTTIKSYLEKFDKPTELQFAEWVDSIYFIDHGLGIKDTVASLKVITIPADQMLTEIVIWSAVAAIISVGDSNGSGEYLQNEELTPGEPLILDEKIFAPGAIKNIYVTSDNSINVKYYVK